MACSGARSIWVRWLKPEKKLHETLRYAIHVQHYTNEVKPEGLTMLEVMEVGMTWIQRVCVCVGGYSEVKRVMRVGRDTFTSDATYRGAPTRAGDVVRM